MALILNDEAEASKSLRALSADFFDCSINGKCDGVRLTRAIRCIGELENANPYTMEPLTRVCNKLIKQDFTVDDDKCAYLSLSNCSHKYR